MAGTLKLKIEDLLEAQREVVRTREEVIRKEMSVEAKEDALKVSEEFGKELRSGKTDTERRIIRDTYHFSSASWREKKNAWREAYIEYCKAKEHFETLAHIFQVTSAEERKS